MKISKQIHMRKAKVSLFLRDGNVVVLVEKNMSTKGFKKLIQSKAFTNAKRRLLASAMVKVSRMVAKLNNSKVRSISHGKAQLRLLADYIEQAKRLVIHYNQNECNIIMKQIIKDIKEVA